ncbi:selenocysteine-specific translation elongation factor [Methylocella silvestris BL2]|uniref:Selenocysteine-specific elongation factor n=1 Tax=Methylocella silvestris (strain DSM 15510 / CIP 108128 / LMG 27833 / NCIMB 13906 / BL2) TaxID=395965 RepID=B8ES23_METSB|nr:selenocysteine-specific translation elongation factor [Methylocella silvestris BL2]
MIIGVAGHIDHGKTALVKALTGVEGDRLAQEKARGMTIDLGFAYLPVEGGQTLGFVDVPGHERFVHTMLAGASGIDFVLLAVAADDGIKPQTLEHLAIIDLLGIARGLIVITKADLTGPGRLAEVEAEIQRAVAGTALEGADVAAVSTLTGAGIDQLRARLVATAIAETTRPAQGRFRLPVDRSFTLQGVGVVVTGAVLSGSVHVGDHVMISPSGVPARVRSLHAQNRPAESGRAGDRCALNLAGPDVSKETVQRGDIVLDPGLHAPTDRIDARLRILAHEAKPIGQWFPVRLHHAAAEVGARIVLLGDEPIRPGASADVQLALDAPIAAAAQDRYVIRDVSAQRTIGGGVFIDLRPPLRRRRTPERAAQRAALALEDPRSAFGALLETAPFTADLAIFAGDRVLSEAQTEELEKALSLVVLPAGATRFAISAARWRDFMTSIMERLSAFHIENPDLQGIGREKLRLFLLPRLPAPAFLAALQKAAREMAIALDGSFVRLAAHEARFAPKDEAAWEAIAPLLGGDARFRPPRVRDIAAATGRLEGDVRRLLKLAGRMGLADEVAHDHFFLRPIVHEMTDIIAKLAGAQPDGAFTAAQFRDLLGNGRKVAIQILEFFDRHGVTVHKGDLRRLDPRRLDLFGAPRPSSGADGGESSPVGRPDFKSGWGSETVSGGFDSHSLPPNSLFPPRGGT